MKKFRITPFSPGGDGAKKFLRTMKLTIIILFISLMQVSATVYSQATKFTFTAENKEVVDVLRQIEDNSKFRFFYLREQVDVTRRVTVKANEATVEQILDELFKGEGVQYEVMNDFLIVLRKGDSPFGNRGLPHSFINQEGTVSGTVTDESGQPLPGVTVVVKGTTQGTITNADGEYSFAELSEDAVLIFSFVGMQTQEIQVSGKTTINVVLEEEAVQMEEVVVLAYGKKVKRENLTGAVQMIDTKVLADRTTPSVTTSLQGAIAGVTVTQTHNAPGQPANILVRNISSWQGSSEPLYVIDGIISSANDLSRLNPNDIESLSVLKDASSAAIYGMRAGNGVILVSTKQGSSGKTQITYKSSYTTQTATKIPERVPSYQSALMLNKWNDLMGKSPDDQAYYTPDELEYFKTNSFDPMEGLWSDPFMMDHNLTISGGQDKIKYFLSGSYMGQSGIIKNYDYDKYTVLAKLSGEVTKGLTFETILNIAWDKKEQARVPYYDGPSSAVIYGWAIASSTFMPWYIDGKPVGNNNINNAELAKGKGGIQNLQNQSIKPILQLEYEIPGVEGLSVKGLFSYNNTYDYDKQFYITPYDYIFKMTGSHGHIFSDEIDTSRGKNGLVASQQFKAWLGGYDNRLEIFTSRYRAYDAQALINYNNIFGKHAVSAMAGYQQTATSGDYLNAWARKYVNENYQEINGADPDPTNRQPSGSQQNLSGQASYFGRLDYNFNQKYFLGFTFRADGTYIFPPEDRWGYFPAGSAAWSISKESFFEPLLPYINEFKIRGSYGLTGSSATGPWQWQQNYSYYSSIGYILDDSPATGIGLGSVINPEITWEKNINTDIGIDMSFLKGLISISGDYWKKKTYDILAPRVASTPNTVGASLPSVNYGEAAAKGLELSLRHQKSFDEFNYSVSLNWAFSTNEYLKIDQAKTVRDYQNLIGRPINGVIWGYQSEGIIRTEEDVDRILAENGEDFTLFGYKPQPGMLMYKDIRGPLGQDSPDGRVDGYDRGVISENGVPRINYGFSLKAGWKGLDLLTHFSGFAKYASLVDPYHGRRPYGFAGVWFKDLWSEFWTPETPNASMPDPTWYEWWRGNNINMESTFWLRDRSFLRLKYVNLSYTLPAKYLQNVQLKGVSVYLAGENLLTFSKYYIDPEQSGIRVLPPLKSYSAGIKVTF